MYASTDARPCTSRLLVVEDDLEMRHFLASVLRRDGYEVIELVDGTDFFDFVVARVLDGHVDSPPADLVISDVRMPGFGGFDLVRVARDMGWKIPIVLITAFGDEHTHADARRLGVLAILDKPFDVDDLRAIVHGALPPTS